MNKVFVVIVTFNGSKWIERCLDSVSNSTVDAKAIIVDNASSDATVEIIKNGYPKCCVVETGQNLGFGKANNIGIRKAIEEGAEYIYLLNQDAWVDNNVFEELIKIKNKYQEYGILSPLQITADRKSIDQNFYRDTICRFCDKKELITNLLLSKSKDVYPTEFVMAAHWFMSVEDIKRVGLFSPAFPHYGEDNNLIDRFHYMGYKIGFCPNLLAVHDREYRIVTQQNKLYWQFKGLLMVWNNPNINSLFKRTKRLCGFIIRSICIGGVSLKEKYSSILKGLRLLAYSNKCREESKNEGAFL